jgi:hypothetical protein
MPSPSRKARILCLKVVLGYRHDSDARLAICLVKVLCRLME